MSGVAVTPGGMVAVSCSHSFSLLDSSTIKRRGHPGALSYSAPLVTEDLVIVAHGPWLEAYTFDGEQAWKVILTEENLSPQIPALARDQDGNILVSLYLGGEVDLGREHTGPSGVLNRSEWTPRLLTVSPEGKVKNSVRTDTPDFRWPEARH